ncbi:MAG: hypothetical protein ABJH20_16080 [Rhizobiaceae bacterium]
MPNILSSSQIRPHGRQLKDLWLEPNTGDPVSLLNPAEQRLLECAARGELCNLGDDRPAAATLDRLIRAEFLRFVILGGDDDHPLHENGVLISGAYVSGSLNLSGTTVSGPLALSNCWFTQDVILTHCQLRTLSLTGCHLPALAATGLTTAGNILLQDGFCATGTVELVGSRIGGYLSCRNGRFLHSELSIDASGATIGANCNLDKGFIASGTVKLSGAQIDGALSCRDATFSCRDKALHAPRIKVANNVDLGEDCRVGGQVSLQGSVIGGDLTFTGGAFDRRVKWEKVREVTCINLRNAEITGTLFWRQIKIARGELNLAGAACRTLNMDRESWDEPAQIRLDNFTYKGFNQLDETTSARFWLEWLGRQPQTHLTTKFRPKPYQQLADVLQSMGHEEEARIIRIARRRRQADYVRLYEKQPSDPLARLSRQLNIFWNGVQGFTVSYGYRPGNALIGLIALSLFGWAIYQFAAVHGIMTPTHPLIYKEAVWEEKSGPLIAPKIPTACHANWVYPEGKTAALCARSIPSEYSTFNALIYSIDVAVPVVDFRMQDDWSPRVVDWQTGNTDWTGWWVRSWEWLQVGFGWTFSLLFVSAIGGIIRRD